jgi:crossover junction endodeoxyribonuclease RusA
LSGLAFTVYGKPVQQGSKRNMLHKQSGKPIALEDAVGLRSWREAVKAAALEAHARTEFPRITGPVLIRMTFCFGRPKGHYLPANTRRPEPELRPDAPPRPSGTPDLSKLVRAVEDAITDAGVWADDALVVDMLASKVYVGDTAALDRPGARIRIIPIYGWPDG